MEDKFGIFDRIIALVAPRGWVDFVAKLLVLHLLLGAMNYGRDCLEHGAAADTFFNNLLEATFVGFPFSVLALFLFWRLKTLHGDLITLATTDMLTGLDNRRAFYEKAAAQVPNPGGTLLMIDVDHFKRINDTFGHAVGDLCLQEIASRLRQEVRAGDIVARLGGEEFVVLLVGADMAVAKKISARLVRGVQLPKQDQPQYPEVTLSIGATSLTGCKRIDDGLRAADAALYAAKSNGRARMEISAVAA